MAGLNNPQYELRDIKYPTGLRLHVVTVGQSAMNYTVKSVPDWYARGRATTEGR